MGCLFKSGFYCIMCLRADALIKTFVNGYSFTNNFTIITFVVCLLLTMTQSFAEEYVYRGFLMQALGSWIKVPIIAIVLQSLFFLHTQFDWIMMLVTLVIGLLFGFMAWYGKGLEISSAMHFSFNYILILSTGFTTGSFLPNSNLDYLMYIVLPIIIIAIIIFMDYKFNWFGFRENKESNS